MSRSHRKHPITGLTTADSEKGDKVRFHKKHRRVNKQILQAKQDDVLLKQPEELDNVYGWDKDGKQHFDPKRFPELMRK